MINLIINGQQVSKAHNVLEELIAELMAEQNLKAGQFVIAVNDALVPATAYASTSLSDGDRIEILTAMVGG